MPPLCELSEGRLLKLLGDGNKEAFDELYNRHSEVVYRTALKFLGNHENAADLTQEIFIKIWTDRSKYSDITNIRAYLSIISRNLAIRSWKKMARDRSALEEWAMQSGDERKDPNIDDMIHLKGLEIFFAETVNQLPPQQRKVYRLAREEGLTYKNIARLLNISPITVKQHMVAANRFVRERWEQMRESS